MRLGEMLVKEGKITSAELEETLKGQAIFGGRFGTNLVEMGILDEDELAHFLSLKTGVPCASPDDLMNIPPQVISLLPEESVKKYRVVPLALNNRKLSLAMTDPTDYATIDEISFATGYIVVPLVTPELRLICALEKYYNVKRELRYIKVAGGGRNRSRATQSPAAPATFSATPSPRQHAAPAPPPPSAPPPKQEEDDFFELLPLEELEPLDEVQIHPVTPAFPATVSPPPPQAATQAATQAFAPAPPAAAAPSNPVAPAAPAAAPFGAPAPASAPLQAQPQEDFSLDGVLRGLTQAADRNDIARLLVGYTARNFQRSAMFLVKGELAGGWLAQIGPTRLPGFDTLEMSLKEPSVLKVVAETKTHYLGPIPPSPCNNRIVAALGGTPSLNQLFAPLLMMGRVVAVLYVDGGTRPLEQSVPELQKLLGKASMAFEILILKSKILMT